MLVSSAYVVWRHSAASMVHCHVTVAVLQSKLRDLMPKQCKILCIHILYIYVYLDNCKDTRMSYIDS